MDDFFVHLTDTHLTATTDRGWDALERFVRQVNAMHPLPAFVVNTGDIVFASMRIHSKFDEFLPVYQRYQKIMAPLKVPLYNALGNHDMTQCDDGTPGEAKYGKDLFKKFCGPRYQSFNWQEIRVVILDEWRITRNEARNGFLLTEDIDDAQLAWLKEDLSTCQPGQTVLFLLHHAIVDYPEPFEKLRGILRTDLQYLEVVGCDHQNSISRLGDWRTMTTASFCGAWWNGPCVDGAPAGYALMFRDPAETIKPYYRGLDEPLAVARPRPDETLTESVVIDAYDPEQEHMLYEKMDLGFQLAGWCDVEIHAGDSRQKRHVFRKPTHPLPLSTDIRAKLEFELVECHTPLSVQWNDETLACFDPGNIGRCEIPLPSNKMRDWNTLHFDGDAILRSPRVKFDDRIVNDPRIERWESLRPDWFEDKKQILWDTTKQRLKTFWRYPEDTFFFPFLEE